MQRFALHQRFTSTTLTQPCSWCEHCHDMHLSGKATQVVTTLSDNVHMQRCWAGWKPAGVEIFHSSKHISPALIVLLVPRAVLVVVHSMYVLMLLSTSLFKLVTRQKVDCEVA